ncbi:potassium transporter [Ureibacillus sp. FSL K6-8385]|uniref:Potassium transporter n=1 Tax=Ureibacillus terrenus TaxID=118246 RepID=A0A540V8I3_9BACL|nr:potassium transporter [Ureibacillus terrenus]MED3660517.1 potassium transporter [Ureibacillus terrenus]TQE92453.1 potassium transporter [Ureibacillus terrenus]
MKLLNEKNSSIILLIALIAALLFALYYYVILPKKQEAASLESSIESVNSEISSIQQQIEEIKANKNLDQATIFDLRKKVPSTRNLDDLVLNIEETQYVTGTKILSIDFNGYDTLVSESDLNDPNASGGEENTEGTAEEDDKEGQDSDEAPVSTIDKESLPPELKLITFEINVESPDFQHLVRFIKEIEKIERIMHIDIINFTLPGEENEISEDPQESIEATVQVTTFYYEGAV